MHGLIALFLEEFALAIILLLIGLAVLCVLIFVMRTIVAPIVSMTMIGLSGIAIASVTLMMVAIFVAMMKWYLESWLRMMGR